MTMKICLVSDVYYPHIGGVPEHIYHLSINLKRLGHEVRILTASYGDNGHFDSLDVVRIGRSINIIKNKSLFAITVGYRLSGQVQRFLQREQFDIVHTHGPLAPVLPYLALKHSQCVNFATFHSAYNESIGYAVFEPVLERYFRKIHGPIAVSDVARQSMAQYFPGNYRIIPNGVDTQHFRPDIKPRPELAGNGPTILFVGRLEPRKGLEYLLRALPLVLKTIPDARLIVVGTGYLEQHYKRMVPRGLAPRITFTGYVAPEDLPSYYATCDVYCSPAIGLESFGIVLLEAMAAQRPVVASDIPGYRNVITHGVEGLCFAPKNSADMARGLVQVLQNRQLQKRMGEAGRRKAVRFDWQKITNEVHDYYLEVMERDRAEHALA